MSKNVSDYLVEMLVEAGVKRIYAVVSSWALALQPHIGWKEAVGYGTSRIKEVTQIISGDKKQ